MTYRLLDAIWLEQGASYMEFPQVMRDVRARVEKCLASRQVQTLEQLQRLLLAAP